MRSATRIGGLVWGLAVIGAGAALVVRAEDAPVPKTYPLWPDGAPGARGKEVGDVPKITVYLAPPEKATGASVVICPGGGYGVLAEHEGKPVAEWLNTLGVAGIVLQYRLGPKYHHPAMLHDAARAIRTVRARAAEWRLDPQRVAILGFSAGGHLASTVGTHFDAGDPNADNPIDRQSSRPDRMILIYPVISLNPPYGHDGSRGNLLGDNPSPELVESLCNDKQVTAQTPPTFLVHTHEDTGVPAENSLLFALALRKAGVPVELHLFEKGRHGLGLGGGDPAFRVWPELCATWLKGQGFLDKKDGGR
jgi:acetyl esterase/lipase